MTAAVDSADGIVVPTGVDALPGATGTEQETNTSINSGHERKDGIGSVCTPSVSEVLAPVGADQKDRDGRCSGLADLLGRAGPIAEVGRCRIVLAIGSVHRHSRCGLHRQIVRGEHEPERR